MCSIRLLPQCSKETRFLAPTERSDRGNGRIGTGDEANEWDCAVLAKIAPTDYQIPASKLGPAARVEASMCRTVSVVESCQVPSLEWLNGSTDACSARF